MNLLVKVFFGGVVGKILGFLLSKLRFPLWIKDRIRFLLLCNLRSLCIHFQIGP